MLHSLKFRELFEHYNTLLVKHTVITEKAHQLHLKEAFRKARHYVPDMNEFSQEAEVDFLMLVKSKGFFLFEVKSSLGERVHAKAQLNVRRALMNVLIDDAITEGKLGLWSSHDLPKYCASIFPSSEYPADPYDPPDGYEYFEDNFSDGQQWQQWWDTLVDSKPTLELEVDMLFTKVVSRIMYTVTNYMPLTLSEGIAELGDDIQQQKILKTFGTMPRIVYDVGKNAEVKSTKLSNEQVTILNGFRRQIIIGPVGSGKTLIIAAKALQLSTRKKQALIVCGHGCEGLKYWYIKVLGLNECYGHDHLEYVFVCTMRELLETKELDPVEKYCLVDEADEIVEEKNRDGSLTSYTNLWNNILKKPFVWIATDKESTLRDIKSSDEHIEGNLNVSSLCTVLRNTVSIFKEFQDKVAYTDLNIEVGHDVEGLPVEHFSFSDIDELCKQTVELINTLTRKRFETSDIVREIDHRDILIYVTHTTTGDLPTPVIELILTELNKANIPYKSFQKLNGYCARLLNQDPLSDSVLIACKESDILSLEFVAVISCEIDCEASPTVLSRAVSQLFRLRYCV